MAVKIRLARRGRKKLAIYNVVVADARTPRDGKYIENLGVYNPNTNPQTIDINEEKAFDWIMKGAQPTETMRRILSHKGIMLKKHLQIGVQKGAISQEDADKKFQTWKDEKESKVIGKVESLTKKKADEAKKRAEAEKKKNEARAAEIKAKNTPPAEVVEEAPDTATESAETPVAEAPAETIIQEEAPVAQKEDTEVNEVPLTEAKESSVEETPVAEEVKEEAPVAETKEEVVEAEAEEPKAEAKEEEPKAEATEEAKDEETKADEGTASEEEKK